MSSHNGPILVEGDIARTVRAFLDAGGRLMLDEQGKLQQQLTISYPFDDWLRPVKTRAMREASIALRWLCGDDHGQRILGRMVSLLGRPASNGWLVLERNDGSAH